MYISFLSELVRSLISAGQISDPGLGCSNCWCQHVLSDTGLYGSVQCNSIKLLDMGWLNLVAQMTANLGFWYLCIKVIGDFHAFERGLAMPTNDWEVGG